MRCMKDCFGRVVENGGIIHMFHEEDKAELLPKNMARTARIQNDR